MAANETSYDLVVVGGGINGVGIARDAAGRGLSVLLVEKDDLASHTSSWSSKLIHGGLRYLEHYEFRLVREALIEREVLLRAAPHLVKPMTFVLPHSPALRPRWMLRIGLFLYDHLGGRKILEPSRAVDLTAGPLGAPLKPSFTHGFTYSDAWVDDSRLVVVNALDAAAKGAVVRTRTRLVGAERAADHWRVRVADGLAGGEQTVRARGLVNAAGPWVSQLIGDVLHLPSRHAVRLVKGSHIVVPALYAGDHAYILQNEDQRIVFTIPYQAGRLTIVGTTDLAYEGDPAKAAITPDETDYLCATVAGYFERPPRPEDVVWSYSGVRPLYDDASGNPSAVTRDYVFDLDTANGAAPLLSVFGGKLTTYRKLAEHAMGKLAPALGVTTPSWTEAASLPGGDIANADFEAFLDAQRRRYPFLPEATLERLAHAYGTRLDRVLGAARSEAELGADLGAGLSEAELRYLVGEEWARTAEDVLWRRTKLGLFLAPDAQAPLRAWFETATAASPAPSAAPS